MHTHSSCSARFSLDSDSGFAHMFHTFVFNPGWAQSGFKGRALPKATAMYHDRGHRGRLLLLF